MHFGQEKMYDLCKQNIAHQRATILCVLHFIVFRRNEFCRITVPLQFYEDIFRLWKKVHFGYEDVHDLDKEKIPLQIANVL